MGLEVVKLECPNCGSPVDTSTKTCAYCGSPIVITSFNSVYNMDIPNVMKYKGAYQKDLSENPDNTDLNLSMGMCLLKLNMYDKAYDCFEKAIDNSIDNPEAYFWAAVSSLKGKRPFLQMRQTVDKAIEYANTARMIEDKGIYSYLIAYLKYDFYELKKLRVEPNYQEELEHAKLSVPQEDIKILAEMLKIEEFDEKLSI